MAEGIAVTGLGVISPFGLGKEVFWERLIAGESAVGALPGASGRPPSKAALIPELPGRELIASPHARRMDELSRRAVAAVRLALDDAGIDAASVPPGRLGIVVGSAYGNMRGTIDFLQRVFTKGPSLASPMLFPNLVLNAAASYASMALGAVGPNLTVSQLEVSGEQAIATGCDLIRQDRADVVVAGGGDEAADIVRQIHCQARALSGQRGGAEWSSPYDAGRNGLVLGEGTAMLVLESRERATGRAARSYAELVADTCFAIPAPIFGWPSAPSSAPRRLRDWLREHRTERVDLVCGGGNSTLVMDACELALMEELFGAAAGEVVLTSIKGATGEFPASGALAAVATCLGLYHGIVPPLCHLESAAPHGALRLAARRGEGRVLQRAMNLAMARGGAVSALLWQACPT